MRIHDLLNNDSENITISVNPTDLKEFALFILEEGRKNNESKSNQNEQLLSKEDVKTRLNVSSTTLWNWEKKKYLIPIKVGRRIFYSSSDLDTLRKSTKT